MRIPRILVSVSVSTACSVMLIAGIALLAQPLAASRPVVRDASAAWATPDELVLQQGLNGYAGAEDTYISAWFPTANYGISDTLRVRSDGVEEALIRFDVPDLPAGAQLLEATLELYSLQRSNASVLNVDVHEITTVWDQMGATWYLPWTYPGAGKDYDDLALETVPLTETQRWYSFDVTVAVQHWLAAPAANHGLILRRNDPYGVYHTFASSEYAVAGVRPLLRIRYVLTPTATATPTPTSTATPTVTSSPTPTPTPTGTATPPVWHAYLAAIVRMSP